MSLWTATGHLAPPAFRLIEPILGMLLVSFCLLSFMPPGACSEAGNGSGLGNAGLPAALRSWQFRQHDGSGASAFTLPCCNQTSVWQASERLLQSLNGLCRRCTCR